MLGKKYRRFAKFCVLEKYLAKGWLNLGRTEYSGRDRLWAGNRLADVYARCAFPEAKALDLQKPFVDVSGGGGASLERILDARAEYGAAMRSVYRDYWPAVRKICIEDEELIIQNPEEKQKLKALFSFNTKVDLCRGLDELIDFYRDWDKGRG